METYGDHVRIVFRDFPLSFHEDAQLAHEAANCANDQGKFWEFHDKLFENQRALKEPNLKQYALDLALNVDDFNSCLASGRHKPVVNQELREGQSIGVTGTPAFFINGRFLNGAQPYEKFASIIDEELELKGIKRGGS